MDQTIVARSAADQIAEKLRHEIESGALAPGVSLNQVDLAERFGLSRIPVREALRQLEAEGYIDYRANKGATVAAALPVADLLEVLEIRECLECRLMHHAAQAIDATTLAMARAQLARMNRTTRLDELRGMHTAFHTILYDTAARPRMVATVNDWRFRFDNRGGKEEAQLRAFVRATQAVHERLLTALANGDAAGASRCTQEEYAIIRSLLTRPPSKPRRFQK